MDTRRIGTVGLAACSLGAAALHFAALGAHWSESWLYGVFFAGVAWFQALWAAWVVHRPTRAALTVGVVGNAVVAAVWVLSRTVGVGVGPAREPEAVGFADGLATVLALLVVAVGVALLAAAPERRWAPASGRAVLGAVVSATIVAVTMAIGTPGSSAQHGHPDQDDTAAAPGPVHHHDEGSEPAGGAVDGTNARDQAGAARLLRTTEAAVAKYANVDTARAAGFRPNPTQAGPLVHYPNDANRRDDAVLDPERPEGLVYYRTPTGAMRLVGALYTAGRGALPPSPGGELTRWHSHTPGCAHPADTPGCEDQVRMYMLHVWLTDRAQDPFAETLRGAVAPGGRSPSDVAGHRHNRV